MEDDLAAIRDLAVRWLDAVSASDVGVLSQLMTDDLVVIHGNGRVLAGREAVVADFISTFNTLRVIQTLRREETILAGAWAFDRARVHTTTTDLRDGTKRECDSHTVTILCKNEAGDWRVARAVGVVERA